MIRLPTLDQMNKNLLGWSGGGEFGSGEEISKCMLANRMRIVNDNDTWFIPSFGWEMETVADRPMGRGGVLGSMAGVQRRGSGRPGNMSVSTNQFVLFISCSCLFVCLFFFGGGLSKYMVGSPYHAPYRVDAPFNRLLEVLDPPLLEQEIRSLTVFLCTA